MNNLEIFFLGDLQRLVKENPTVVKEIKRNLKDIIEGLGVPHTEVGKIYHGNEETDLAAVVNDGGKLIVCPVEPENIQGEVKFILDVHLGTLARYLRMMGFDSLYENSYEDQQIVDISLSQNRIILTRDRGILKRKLVKKGYLIRDLKPRIQLNEVLKRYKLYDRVDPLTRCFKCNDKIFPIHKENIKNRVPEKSRKIFEEFYICKKCHMIYWKGSHYDRFKKIICEVKELSGSI
ncbi:Mut7-C RNAse domain-containing protein [uncultured Ilyobacter sp.]|uniref:Mut7-C RNAse domain-containing protein n=1 Tax=uncultured Ilyobacter sp. TaxID=544433 RepID=UPI0029C78F4D|nr:Mut7-C RNAse domain-containing protein [uncultured Ilyobacter sp.]